mmetsp:Transcript_62679/g.141462  ORF Transcript_62679/g.141462 Transcript_62679/m.141462 type:complete len:212 (+) Transcript_62679:621-1256(+)
MEACGAPDAKEAATAEEGNAHELVPNETDADLGRQLRATRAVECQVIQLPQQPCDPPLEVVLGQDLHGGELREKHHTGLAARLCVGLGEGQRNGLLHELVVVGLHVELLEEGDDLVSVQGHVVLFQAPSRLLLELFELGGNALEHLAECPLGLHQTCVEKVLWELGEHATIHGTARNAPVEDAQECLRCRRRVDGNVLPRAEQLLEAPHQG